MENRSGWSRRDFFKNSAAVLPTAFFGGASKPAVDHIEEFAILMAR